MAIVLIKLLNHAVRRNFLIFAGVALCSLLTARPAVGAETNGTLALSGTENPVLPDAGYVKINSTGDAGTWTQRTNTPAPAARYYHTALWTGSEMLIWGGLDGNSVYGFNYFNDGARYDPAGNSWTAVTTNGAPAARSQHTAVWNGSEMIVWGGSFFDGSLYFWNDGGRYNPAGNSWTAMSTNGAPNGRAYHTAVWTGSEMLVWGGNNYENYNDT